MTTEVDIVEGFVAAMTAAGIAGGAGHIYSPRDWPTYRNQYPIVLIQSTGDDKQSLGPNVPQFTTLVVVQVTARIKAAAAANDAGAVTADVAIDTLKRAIEVAVINDYALGLIVQDYKWVRSRTKISAEGEDHIGELVAEYGVEIYQGPEDFAAPIAINLEEMSVTDTNPAFDDTVKPRIEFLSLYL